MTPGIEKSRERHDTCLVFGAAVMKLRRLVRTSSEAMRKKIAEESKAPATGNSAMLFGLLWCLAILVFGVGDLLTSSLAFGLGAVEGNPILRSVMGIFGDGIWPLLIIKGIVLGALFVLSCESLGIGGWAIPIVLTCAGIYLLVHNIEVLMALLCP